ncbi:MAG: hypothetical protein AVDCRST_MAG66-3262, partial [uncultured Pseudonocardia sp.]
GTHRPVQERSSPAALPGSVRRGDGGVPATAGGDGRRDPPRHHPGVPVRCRGRHPDGAAARPHEHLGLLRAPAPGAVRAPPGLHGRHARRGGPQRPDRAVRRHRRAGPLPRRGPRPARSGAGPPPRRLHRRLARVQPGDPRAGPGRLDQRSGAHHPDGRLLLARGRVRRGVRGPGPGSALAEVPVLVRRRGHRRSRGRPTDPRRDPQLRPAGAVPGAPRRRRHRGHRGPGAGGVRRAQRGARSRCRCDPAARSAARRRRGGAAGRRPLPVHAPGGPRAHRRAGARLRRPPRRRPVDGPCGGRTRL